jgi:hypothetical protein
MGPWATLAIIAIKLPGAFLRLYQLGQESLWLDELWSWWMSHDVAYFDHYFEQQGSRLWSDVKGGREQDIPKVAEALWARQPERLWFIRTDKPVQPAFLAYLQRDWRLVTKHEFLKADVWLFERK